MKSLFFLALSFCMLPAWGQAPWTEVRTQVIPAVAPTPGVQQIPLQLVVDETSKWAVNGELEAQVSKTSGIFRRCGIELGRVEIKLVRYSQATIDALNNPNPYRGPSEVILTKGDLSDVRPLMWLFDNRIASTAKAFNRTSIERLSRGSPVDVTPLLHTSVMSGHHRTNTPIPGANPSYNTLAHELAHILGDLDHVDEADNLMSSRTVPNSKSGRLNPDQCKSIQEYCLLNFSNIQSDVSDITSPASINSLKVCVE